MPIEKELEYKFKIANQLYRQGFKRVRFNYFTIGFKNPVETDLVWLGKDKEPILSANITNIHHIDEDKHAILKVFSVTKKENNQYKLELLCLTTTEKLKYNTNIKNYLKDISYNDTKYIAEVEEMKRLRTLLGLKDNSRKAIMYNFSCLAKVAKLKQDKSQDNQSIKLSETIQKAISKFNVGDAIWNNLGEYTIHYLGDYKLSKLPLEGLATLLDYSPKEEEYILYYEFLNSLIDEEFEDITSYIPFLGDSIYAYAYCNLQKPLSLVGYVNNEIEKRWAETLFTLAGTAYEVKVKEPEEVVMETSISADHIFLIPPYEDRVNNLSILNNFKVYEFARRRKEKLEALALEHH